MLDKVLNVRAYFLEWQGMARCALGRDRVGAALQAYANTPDCTPLLHCLSAAPLP